jgi:hypothetical protein
MKIACETRGKTMAVGIMIAGLLAAVFGTTLAIAMGLNLSSALIIYGLFGLCGGSIACLASLPAIRNLGRHRSPRNRTLG